MYLGERRDVHCGNAGLATDRLCRQDAVLRVFSYPDATGAEVKGSSGRQGLISEYEICSPKTGERMTGALRFVFLELGRLVPKLGEEDKCNSIIEQLAYSVRYMKDLKECPKQFVDPLFPLLFGASEFARLDVNKQMQVTMIMRTELDRIAENNYARIEGRAEQAREDAKAFRELGVDVAIIAKATGLSEEEVRGL